MSALLEETALSQNGRESIYLPRLARIASVEQVTRAEKVFELEQEGGLGHRPGQFVEVSAPGVGEAPISLCSSPAEGPGFRICVRRVGTLTTYLHGLGQGDWVGLRGPFGRGFPMEEAEGMDLLFVAGGIGMAPLRSAIRHALDRRDRYGEITVLYGARTLWDLLFQGDLVSWSEQAGVRVLTTVDIPPGKDLTGQEGATPSVWPDERAIGGKWCWTGRVGVITTLFPDLKLNPERTVALVVGPPVMYRFVLLELLGKGIPEKQIVFSIERRMKCGVGKCGHCQINGTYVCQEGPAFSYARLGRLWEAVERAAPVA
ncbi:MAG: hypothetical protein A3F84_11465 [Candidatus Handelsmanbacteria bacterium RIFCSPLOWO2_12_FULL_64_10]|uniref:FAD-binding FR-type domain-containing protein n=1 Tax=Handelsmanbacteria sp. (strain RIFCSPLOWO2_12_FULL_64_10) TaxID=1817868 RepID=A0A1F6C6A3_HANXR|nr:MAG: hypothetical protein A3F84_11465 [Candidatus Handelsmanbacteria bacterium RIFCSPLOWO2_12_FULL_64_10]